MATPSYAILYNKDDPLPAILGLTPYAKNALHKPSIPQAIRILLSRAEGGKMTLAALEPMISKWLNVEFKNQSVRRQLTVCDQFVKAGRVDAEMRRRTVRFTL